MSETTFNPAVIDLRDAQVASLRDTTHVVLEKVNWSVLPGEFWVVAGPQYSGKTDLLLHAAGLMTPVQGICRVFGCDTREFDDTLIAERLRVGFAFADGKLFNQLTIAGNVALPLRYHKNVSEVEAVRAVEVLLDLLELTPYANHFPGNVATNWRQRAALGRALMLKPEVLLLDNPNGGLISRHRQWLVNFLDQLWRGHEYFGGRPMTIIVTSDDLRTWEHPQRRFAALHEGTFTALGAWGGEEFTRHHTVKDLLSLPTGTIA